MNRNKKLPALFLLLWVSAPAAMGEQGKALYEEHCAACHTIGGGDSVGPDLKGVTDRRKAGWLGRVIAEPDRLTAESDPEQLALVKKWGLEMPNLGLSLENVREIIEYIKGGSPAVKAAAGKALPAAAAAEAKAAPEVKPAGSAAAGRELFFGTRRLAAGGPACAGCHSVSAGNITAGGSYSVSLFGTFKKLGVNGIKAVLTALPFPVKAAAFKGRAVTEAEIYDLAAFLEVAGKADPEPGDGLKKLVFAGFLAAAGAIVLIALVWSGRKKKGVKDDILSRQAGTY